MKSHETIEHCHETDSEDDAYVDSSPSNFIVL